jgi:hypothetical protein
MIFSCYEVSHQMKGNIQEVTEKCWWPRLFWMRCCNVRKQEGSNYSWLNMHCIFLQIRLLVYEIHFSADLMKLQSYKFLRMIYLVQNQFQLMCGWILVVNGSLPQYTFECVWTLHHHPPSVLSQTGQRFPRTFITT